MRNSAAWFEFARERLVDGSFALSLERDPESFVSTLSFPSIPSEFPLGLIAVSEEEVSSATRSGEPTRMVRELDTAMRIFREADSHTPMAAFLKPEAYWTRSPAWMLGEYLAERDLLLWIDLLHLHPQQAATWSRFSVDCGLACPRTFLVTDNRLSLEDLPLVVGTGTWWLTMKEAGSQGEIQQV